MSSIRESVLLVGVYRHDWEADPEGVGFVIAGVTDGGTWEVEPVEETEARWKACKAAYDPSGTDYEWREVWVKIDEDELRRHFNGPKINAVVTPPSEGKD